MKQTESGGTERSAGFSLIELMITLGVAAILAGMAAPSFVDYLQRDRMVGGVNELVAYIQKARFEASRTNGLVSICSSPDEVDCINTNNNNWEAGYLVDSNPPHYHQRLDVDDLTIRPTPATEVVTFNARGFTSNAPVTFVFCDSRGAERARALILLPTGRTALAQDIDNDIIVNDHNGDNVTCP